MILVRRFACIVSIGAFLAALIPSPTPAQTVKSQTEAADPTTRAGLCRRQWRDHGIPAHQQRRSVDPKNFTSKILGRHRQTSYYLLPVALLASEGRLIADFAVHRTGYQLASLTDSPIDFVRADSRPLPFPGDTPDRNALRDFVNRHFQDPRQD